MILSEIKGAVAALPPVRECASWSHTCAVMPDRVTGMQMAPPHSQGSGEGQCAFRKPWLAVLHSLVAAAAGSVPWLCLGAVLGLEEPWTLSYRAGMGGTQADWAVSDSVMGIARLASTGVSCPERKVGGVPLRLQVGPWRFCHLQLITPIAMLCGTSDLTATLALHYPRCGRLSEHPAHYSVSVLFHP